MWPVGPTTQILESNRKQMLQGFPLIRKNIRSHQIKPLNYATLTDQLFIKNCVTLKNHPASITIKCHPDNIYIFDWLLPSG